MALFLTATDIEALPAGRVAFVAVGTKLTPLARDRAGDRGIEVVELPDGVVEVCCEGACSCGCEAVLAPSSSMPAVTPPDPPADKHPAKTAYVSIFANKIIRGPDANVFRNLIGPTQSA